MCTGGKSRLVLELACLGFDLRNLYFIYQEGSLLTNQWVTRYLDGPYGSLEALPRPSKRPVVSQKENGSLHATRTLWRLHMLWRQPLLCSWRLRTLQESGGRFLSCGLEQVFLPCFHSRWQGSGFLSKWVGVAIRNVGTGFIIHIKEPSKLGTYVFV